MDLHLPILALATVQIALTLAAVERLARTWLGIDQSPLAHRIAKALRSTNVNDPDF